MSGARVTTPEEAEQLARRYKADGYDLIKTHEGAEPGGSSTRLAATAAEVDIPFGGHVSDFVGLRRALELGQVSVDHLDNYVEALVPEDTRPDDQRGLAAAGALIDAVDESRIPELVQATVDAGAWVVPTMVLWETAFYNDRGSVGRAARAAGGALHAAGDGGPLGGRRWIRGWGPPTSRPTGGWGRAAAPHPGGAARRRRQHRAGDRLAADLQRARLRHAPRDGALRGGRDDALRGAGDRHAAAGRVSSGPRTSSARWRWAGGPT